MKLVAILLILTLSWITASGDAGNAYRYKAKFQLSDETEITGYFYFATYQRKFNPGQQEFKNYIFSNFHFPMRVHFILKELTFKNGVVMDFTEKNTVRHLKKEEIKNIILLEEIEYTVGSRLIEVDQAEFELLNPQNFITEIIYNEKISENCFYYIISCSESFNLSAEKVKIEKNLSELIRAETERNKINSYMDSLKPELLKEKVILITYCEAL